MVDHEKEIQDEEQTNHEQIEKQEQGKHQWGTLSKSTNELCFCLLIYCLILALNDKEIVAQALIFMIAGYETTSVLMSFVFHVMATQPIIQEKVYEEIRQELGDVSQINAEERRYLIVLFRMKLLMKILVNFNIWIWLLMKHFECIHQPSG
jgi:hypothetical protein